MKYKEKIIDIDDNEYPELLKKISNPPQRLYILGKEENLNLKSIAIIGSRNCSEKGKDIAKQFSYDLSQLGFCIISGMAKGIDTSAHIGALNAGGKTIAVLGSGFNHIFPKENIKLFERIIENGGTVVSEYPINTKPESKKFIERNRIVSGLSLGVLIVEAKWRSGTSITADFARRQNKKIFCIAHDLDDNTGEGTNRLIKKGAHLVTELTDITRQFDFIKNQKIKGIPRKNENYKEIPDEYVNIYKCIENNINTTNEIIKKLKINIKEANYALTMLELGNYIYKMQGKFYIK